MFETDRNGSPETRRSERRMRQGTAYRTVLGLLGIVALLASGCEPSGEASETGTDTSILDTSRPDTASKQDVRREEKETFAADTSDTRTSADADVREEPSDSILEFRIVSPRSNRPVEYRLEVVEEPKKVRDGSRFEAEQQNDTITSRDNKWLIDGETGTAPSANNPHGDSYRWRAVQNPSYGISCWSTPAPAGDYTITIDGVEVDPSTLPEPDPDCTSSTSSNDCLGGGSCYQSKVPASKADATVGPSATLQDLQNALQNASQNDVVYVDPGADIDLGFFPNSPSIEVPAGVTLASGRGTSEGCARLHADKKSGTKWIGSDTIAMNDDSRITGFCLEGPTPNRKMGWLGGDHDYTDGIDLNGASNVEIDNNEIYGWPQAAVADGDPVHVHHNFIHDNDQSGLGYGVSGTEWKSVIEYNRFERNRHAVAGSGDSGEGYVVRFNVFGNEGLKGAGHKIDMHEDGNTGMAGTEIEVYRNTIEYPDAQGVFLRGTPRRSAEIYRNWFYNSTQPCLTQNRGSYCAIEVRASSFNNVNYHDNHYGSTAPSCNVGAPRNGCGP